MSSAFVGGAARAPQRTSQQTRLDTVEPRTVTTRCHLRHRQAAFPAVTAKRSRGGPLPSLHGHGAQSREPRPPPVGTLARLVPSPRRTRRVLHLQRTHVRAEGRTPHAPRRPRSRRPGYRGPRQAVPRRLGHRRPRNPAESVIRARGSQPGIPDTWTPADWKAGAPARYWGRQLLREPRWGRGAPGAD